MKSHPPVRVRFDTSLDLPARIELAMSAYKKLGHVNRKLLIATYRVTQLQAGIIDA